MDFKFGIAGKSREAGKKQNLTPQEKGMALLWLVVGITAMLLFFI